MGAGDAMTDALSGELNSVNCLVDERELRPSSLKILPAAVAMPPPPPVIIATLPSNLCLNMMTSLFVIYFTQLWIRADCSVLLDDSRTARNQIVYFLGR
jgi:hypothetical protein